MATGGMVLEPLSREQRRELEINADEMALRVTNVGRYGPHGAAIRKGARSGDVLLSFDGETSFLTEQQLHTYVVASKSPGQTAPIQVLRNGERLEFSIPLQP